MPYYYTHQAQHLIQHNQHSERFSLQTERGLLGAHYVKGLFKATSKNVFFFPELYSNLI